MIQYNEGTNELLTFVPNATKSGRLATGLHSNTAPLSSILFNSDMVTETLQIFDFESISLKNF